LIAAPLPTDTVLDYGCGDAHLFSHFLDRLGRSNLVGYDPNPLLLAEASQAVQAGAQLTADVEQLKRERPLGFSLIYCIEVCEHLTDKALGELFDNLKALLAPRGSIIFGVPIETGPSGLIKNLYRTAKGMRHPASVRNALLTLVAAPVERQTTDVGWFGDHTGFRHGKFKAALRARGFQIHKTHHLPFPFMGPVLNNEIYFVCTKAFPVLNV
jgi:2-polyprenyl-3-methyl-5-hydroxy-6-metoxy-1,4-benzoquinol methylase